MALDTAPDLGQQLPDLKQLGLKDEQQGPVPDGESIDQFDNPIPGQSLTRNPDERLPFEQEPKFAELGPAVEALFGAITGEDNITEVLDLMRKELPVEDIAQVFIFEMFRKGLITPDLMLLMIEPVINSLIFIADYANIEVVIYEDDDMESSKSKEGAELAKKLKAAGPEAITETAEEEEPLLDLTELEEPGEIEDGS